MGQYWKVINLDKRQTLGHWGKLGEFLFSPSPSWLVELLARPMEPLDTSTRGVNCVGSWAGDRIICVGDYIDDYPKCMLTKSEAKVLRETNLCDFASEHYEELHPSGFTFPRSAAFSTDRIWILRNLSKRQYVRADVLAAASEGEIVGPIVDTPGFGHVICSRISWSSDSSSSMSSYEGDITRGIWAGHRFDISTLESVGIGESGKQWKNVSKKVAKEITEIWECE